MPSAFGDWYIRSAKQLLVRAQQAISARCVSSAAARNAWNRVALLLDLSSLVDGPVQRLHCCGLSSWDRSWIGRKHRKGTAGRSNLSVWIRSGSLSPSRTLAIIAWISMLGSNYLAKLVEAMRHFAAFPVRNSHYEKPGSYWQHSLQPSEYYASKSFCQMPCQSSAKKGRQTQTKSKRGGDGSLQCSQCSFWRSASWSPKKSSQRSLWRSSQQFVKECAIIVPDPGPSWGHPGPS